MPHWLPTCQDEAVPSTRTPSPETQRLPGTRSTARRPELGLRSTRHSRKTCSPKQRP